MVRGNKKHVVDVGKYNNDVIRRIIEVDEEIRYIGGGVNAVPKGIKGSGSAKAIDDAGKTFAVEKSIMDKVSLPLAWRDFNPHIRGSSCPYA